MNTTDAAKILFSDLANELGRQQPRRLDCSKFIKLLLPEIKAANLDFNFPNPGGITPIISWEKIFPESGDWQSSAHLRCINKISPLCSWFRADQFYPEPQYKTFSQNVWGSLIAGQHDAVFHTEDRFIALLILVDAHTVYPLHAHRIEEIYYILSGHADWSHDGKTWETLEPGSIFYNQSYEPHTIRTSSNPVLTIAFYLPPFGWEGGLL